MSDYYLNKHHFFERIANEWWQYRKLILAVDFDDTIFDYHKTGRKYEDMIKLLKRWRPHSEILITTGNSEKEYEKIRNYLEEIDLEVNGINTDGSVTFGGRKVYANAYLDDRGGLGESYNVLNTLIRWIENYAQGKNGDVITEEYWKYLTAIDFDKLTENLIKLIQTWFYENGNGCKAIVGISGGKDSSIVAKLCVEALGRDRVVGILMPNEYQSDIEDSMEVCEQIGIRWYNHDIGKAYKAMISGMVHVMSPVGSMEVRDQVTTNLPARIRMATLYMYSQQLGGRVMNTCNYSEDAVGYATRYGDSAGDVSILGDLTVTEVKEVGHTLGLPEKFIEKTPSDGLCGKTDEDNLGFTYFELDQYLRTGICKRQPLQEKIDSMIEKNQFKLETLPVLNPFKMQIRH